MSQMLLSERQTETLRGLVNCIIPADDYPNGWNGGVGAYLERLLTQEPQFLFTYRVGLDSICAGTPEFSALAADAQNALLTHLEQEEVRGAFFRLLVGHVMEGFYADPGSGGNRNGIAWQMLGYKVTV